jgi:hypothetical protein
MKQSKEKKEPKASNQRRPPRLYPVEHEEIDVSVSEVLALMPKNTCIEDKGTFVREKLYEYGYRIMKEERKLLIP